MKRDNRYPLPATEHLLLATLRQYQADALPAPERHGVERHLLDCDLCADVLEGMQGNSGHKTQRLTQEINERVKKSIAGKKNLKRVIPSWQNYGVAAAIALLLVCGSLVIYYNFNLLNSKTERLPVAGSPQLPVLKPANPLVKAQNPTADTSAILAQVNNPTRLPPDNAAYFPSQPRLTIRQNQAVTDKSSRNPAYKTERSTSISGPIDSAQVIAETEVTAPAPDQNSKIALLQPSMQADSVAGTNIISGQVFSDAGQVLPGVTVIIKGTSIGTATDAQGKYSLVLPPGQEKDVTLIYNFIGFETFEKNVIAENRNYLAAVQLKADMKSLSEVVVTGYGTSTSAVNKNITIQEKAAKPKAGRRAFKNYVQSNLRYPPEALQKKQQGRVTVGFTVNKDGTLSDFNILNSLSPACDAEAIRLIQEGPAWKPTYFDETPVVQQVQVVIRFKLPKK